MFKIGDMSRFGRVSVKTLRYYEELGLLIPARVDTFTSYRYYTADQLSRLHRILALKEIGFSLEQIGHLLHENLSPAGFQAMLQAKREELTTRMSADAALIAQIDLHLQQIETEGKMPDYDVVIKKVEPQLIASLKATIPDWESVMPTFNRIFDEVMAYVNANGGKIAGPAFDMWHDAPKEHDMRVEACVPLKEPIAESEEVKVYELVGVETMACTIHHGPFTSLEQAYGALMQWIQTNGYQIAGPNRELYLAYERTGNPENYVTEIQFPVVKS